MVKRDINWPFGEMYVIRVRNMRRFAETMRQAGTAAVLVLHRLIMQKTFTYYLREMIDIK